MLTLAKFALSAYPAESGSVTLIIAAMHGFQSANSLYNPDSESLLAIASPQEMYTLLRTEPIAKPLEVSGP